MTDRPNIPHPPDRTDSPTAQAVPCHPRLARLAFAGFFGLLLAVPLVRLAGQWQSHPFSLPEPALPFQRAAQALGRPVDADDPFHILMTLNRRLRLALHEGEEQAERSGWLYRRVRPWWQAAMFSLFGDATDDALAGRGQWLFHRRDIDCLLSRSADLDRPARAVIDFHHQLQERHIDLLVVPVPVKTVVVAHRLTGSAPLTVPLQHPRYDRFISRLKQAGVEVLDPARLLLAEVRAGRPPYLKTDTHWRPQAVRLVAGALARRLAGRLPPARPPVNWQHRPAVTIRQAGDIARYTLGLPPSCRLLPVESVRLEPVGTATGQPFKPDPTAAILLLGDSFTNIYSDPSLGWGRSAGLAEQLACLLRQTVDVIAINDGGAAATRQALVLRLVRNRHALDHVKIIIWQFAVRDLTEKPWPRTALPPAPTGRQHETAP